MQVSRAVAAENLGDGFLVPPLIRFVNGEEAYLSMSNGRPRAYFNIEDHISKSSGMENTKFQVRILICACHIVGMTTQSVICTGATNACHKRPRLA